MMSTTEALRLLLDALRMENQELEAENATSSTRGALQSGKSQRK